MAGGAGWGSMICSTEVSLALCGENLSALPRLPWFSLKSEGFSSKLFC